MEGRGIWEGTIVVVFIDGDNNDKGTGPLVQGQGGMGGPSSLSDPLPRWTEDNQGNRGGGVLVSWRYVGYLQSYTFWGQKKLGRVPS